MNFRRPEYELFNELAQEINSPLAAIRNALYLAHSCTRDAEVQRYLQIADQEVALIAQILLLARAEAGVLAQQRQEGNPPLAGPHAPKTRKKAA
jgi:signal transduction histidine kinase